MLNDSRLKADRTEQKCQRNVTWTNAIRKLCLLKDLMHLKKHTVYENIILIVFRPTH